MAAINFYTIMALVKASVKSNTSSFQELVEFCFGRVGIICLNIMLLFFTWGILASFSVILADEMPAVLKRIYFYIFKCSFSLMYIALVGVPGSDFMLWFVARKSQVILVSFFVILPIALSRSLAGLAKFSFLALVGIVFIIGCITAVAPTVPKEFKGAVDEPIEYFRAAGIMNATGVLGFAYACHHNILLSYARLHIC